MDVLLVESRDELGLLWHRHLERSGITVHRARTQFEATDLIARKGFDVIVLDLVLAEGSALAVADFASYRQTDCRVIFVTNTSFFSDGSIFNLCANACAFLPAATKPEDLAAMVEHYGSR